MSYTEQFAEVHYPLANEPPDTFAFGAAFNVGWVSMENYHRIAIVVHIGDMVATSTINMRVMEGLTAAGGTPLAIAGKASTALTAAGGDGNEIVVFEIRSEELTPGYTWVNLEVTVAVADSELSVIYYGIEPRYAPVPTANWSEIVD